MGNRGLTALVAVLLVTLSCRPALRSGDLLFVGYREDGACAGMAAAIAAATASGDIRYVHVAVLDVDDTGSIWVIEASPERGVSRHPLDTLLADFRAPEGGAPVWEVCRLRDRSAARACVARACGYLGEEYDVCFLPGNGMHYCSELVYDACLRADGSPVFDTVPMNFKNADGFFPAYWTAWFARLGLDIPQGVAGTNPAQLRNSKNLVHLCFL
ncbi:MAG: hypothetical protein J5871_05475 [Bacteroidales bacterium]|nr:hypothetical protein [Bacteroidales bacterium]